MRALVLLSCLISSVSWAAKKSTSGGGTGTAFRLIAGATSAKPAEVNQSFESQGLEKVSASLLLGGELGYAFSGFGLGIRYLSNQVSRGEQPDQPTSEYSGYIGQNILLAMAHVPLINKDYFKFELFGGIGSAATRLKVKTATQTGELNRKLFDGMVSTGGVALSLGYKNFFIVLEGGYLDNKISSFARTGTIDNSIQTINLSGSFATAGVLLYGSGAGDFFDWVSRKMGMTK